MKVSFILLLAGFSVALQSVQAAPRAKGDKPVSCAECGPGELSQPEHMQMKKLYLGLRETAQATLKECGLSGSVAARASSCRTKRKVGQGWTLITRVRAPDGYFREIWRDDAPGGLIWSGLEDAYEVKFDRSDDSLTHARRDIHAACSSSLTAVARGKGLSTAWSLPSENDFKKAIQNGVRTVLGKDDFDRAYWLKPHSPEDADYSRADDLLGHAVFEAYESEPQKEVLMMRKNPSAYSVRCVLKP